jgi:ABC-type Fe3+-hydroxamate transport system substrate-binding protein
MLHFTDMMGNNISLDAYPQRIVSVVPSQTELLYSLKLEDEVVGITKFCVHPNDWFRNKKRVGGTKTLKIEEIVALKPDVVIANKEENTQSDIEQLQKCLPVWVSDIQTVSDAYSMIMGIGTLVNRVALARQIVAQVQQDFSLIPPIFKDKKIAYFIWKNPWMVAAKNTFVDAVLCDLGAINVFENFPRYPEVSNDMIRSSGADIVLLSSEPFPFGEQHIAELQALLPRAKILLVDGEMFSWYGSRLLHLKQYISELTIG